MGEQLKQTGNEAVKRWQQKMPRFFRQLMVLCACVAVTAFTVNTAMVESGAEPHEWWRNVYPLLIGVPSGMIVVCKLTVAGGYKEIDIDSLSKGQVDRVHRETRNVDAMSGEQYNDSDIVTESNEDA